MECSAPPVVAPTTKVSFYTIGRLLVVKSTQFCSRRKQTLLVPDVGIFSGEMHPGEVDFVCIFVSWLQRENRWPFHTEKPGDEQEEYLQGRDGVIINVLMFPSAIPSWCLHMQPAIFHGMENSQWHKNQASVSPSCGFKPSSLCRLCLGVENIYIAWTGAFYYSKREHC